MKKLQEVSLEELVKYQETRNNSNNSCGRC